METTLTATKAKEKIEAVFAEAIVTGDRVTLEDLLVDGDEYNIENDLQETVDTDKPGFINWIMNKRIAQENVEYYFDACINCLFGAPVVIFNNGFFPISASKKASRKERGGLMLDIENGNITAIRFCFTFLKTENRNNFEIQSDLIKAYMEKHDASFDQAWVELNIAEKQGIPQNERYGHYNDRCKFIVVGEFQDRGYVLCPAPDMKRANAIVEEAKAILQRDTEQPEKAFLVAVKEKWKYPINNTNTIPESITDVDLGILTCRIIALSPDYSQMDYINQRKAGK